MRDPTRLRFSLKSCKESQSGSGLSSFVDFSIVHRSNAMHFGIFMEFETREGRSQQESFDLYSVLLGKGCM